MPRKNKTNISTSNNVLMLPSDNKEMEMFINNNKTYLTEHVLSSIEFALDNKLPFVEVFSFNDSDFVITVSEKDFLINVDYIYNHYLDNEKYEFCPRVVKLQSVLKNLNNSNEKKIEAV